MMSTEQSQRQVLLVPILSRADTTTTDTAATSASGLPPPRTMNYGTLQPETVLQSETVPQPESSPQPGSGTQPESSSQLETTADNTEATISHEVSPPIIPRYGKPMRKPLFQTLDLAAVVLSMITLILGLLTVSTSFPFAAKLQYTNQIIIIGFLLAVMSHCSQRLFLYLFILLEARFGSSSLQNYDGILKWAPWTNQLRFLWRFCIMILLILPLSLSILYKRFTGGVGILQSNITSGLYAPTGPPGLQNIGFLGVMANATIPFIGATSDDTPLPTFTDGATAYGFNILLLSNSSAAALDSPISSQVSDIQRELNLDDVAILTANVRATVVSYNSTAESHRNDESFWQKYFPLDGDDGHLDMVQLIPMLWEYFYVVRAKNTPGGNDPWQWDHSWIFVATLTFSTPIDRLVFQQKALGFDIKRHACQGTWMITRSSIDLLSGNCADQPLAYEFQYFQNSFMTAAIDSLYMQGQYLGRFAKDASHWALPTHVVTIASLFESSVASAGGFVHLQPDGPLWNIWNLSSDSEFPYNETYLVANTSLHRQVPTLRADAWFYVILWVQPVMTIIAFLATMFLYETPISRGFGLVSILAGVERDSLDVLAGATLSGELEKPVKLTIDTSGKGVSPPRIFYVVDENRKNGRIFRRRQYC